MLSLCLAIAACALPKKKKERLRGHGARCLTCKATRRRRSRRQVAPAPRPPRPQRTRQLYSTSLGTPIETRLLTSAVCSILSPDYPPPPRPHHQSTRGLSSFLSHPYIEKREEEIGIAEPDSGGPSGILVWREKRKLKHRFAVSLALPPSLPPTSSPLAFSSLSFLTLLVIATRAATADRSREANGR